MGTSSIKATLIDEKGEVIASSKVKSELLNPQEGFFELDAEKTWWGGIKSALSKIAKANSLQGIRSICFSSMCGTFVPVDASLNPVHHAILYGIDTRAVKQIERLNKKYGKSYLAEHIGGLFNTHSIIPKVIWLKENKPKIYQRTAFFIESNNYVSSKLTGITAWDYPTAAGTKLLDLQTMALPNTILSDFDIDKDKFPSFKWPMDITGTVTKEASEETGLPEGIPVITGACDINGEATACGGINPGDFVVVFGSTVSTLFTLDKLQLLEGFTPGVSIIEGTFRLGAATSSGGRFVQWMKELLNYSEIDFSNQNPTEIVILPYIDGSRAPYDNPDSKGVIFGLRKNTTDSTVLNAAVESLGYELNLLLSKLEIVSNIPDQIHVLGGMSENKDILQLISDIVGKKMIVYNNIDASYGDALLAMTAEKSYQEIEQLEFVQKYRNEAIMIVPDLEKTKAYQPFSDKFKILYEKIEELF